MAELYKENGENEKSFKFAVDAINNFGDIEYKVDLLLLSRKFNVDSIGTVANRIILKR